MRRRRAALGKCKRSEDIGHSLRPRGLSFLSRRRSCRVHPLACSPEAAQGVSVGWPRPGGASPWSRSCIATGSSLRARVAHAGETVRGSTLLPRERRDPVYPLCQALTGKSSRWRGYHSCAHRFLDVCGARLGRKPSPSPRVTRPMCSACMCSPSSRLPGQTSGHSHGHNLKTRSSATPSSSQTMVA